VFAFWKLFKSVVASEIVETNVAPDNTRFSHSTKVGYYFYFVEILVAQTNLHKEDPIFMQESYALLNALHFFLYVCLSIFKNFVVSQLIILVKTSYKL